MKILKLVVVLFAVSVIGCRDDRRSRNHPEVIAANKLTLSNNPEQVGKLADDRMVYRYRIDMGTNEHAHWVYLVEGTNVITVNRKVTESGGEDEITFNEVDVVIKKKK